jgi:hypothetical protein
MSEKDSDYVETMRAVLNGNDKSFVLFENGTVVVFVSPGIEIDLADTAKELMREFGPVHPASPAGDFSTLELPDGRGWAVTCHHPDILTLLLPCEASHDSSTLVCGILGRTKRGLDAETLKVIHVEDRRHFK